MGITRTVGLLFFMTILVGGCIAAVNGPAPLDPSASQPIEVSWDQAVLMFTQGQVINYSQGLGLAVYLQLSDGAWVVTVAPSTYAVAEVLAQCGDLCNGLLSGNA